MNTLVENGKKEQLKKIGEWLVLQTGGEFNTDSLLIGKEDYSNWNSFEISSDKTEKDSLWKSKNIKANKMGKLSKVSIKEIIGNEIIINYLVSSSKEYKNQEVSEITYELDQIKGIPVMRKIKNKTVE